MKIELSFFIGMLCFFLFTGCENKKKPQEYLTGIELYSDEVKIWEKINVGSGKKDVLDFIGNIPNYMEDGIIYSNLGDYTIQFTFEPEYV